MIKSILSYLSFFGIPAMITSEPRLNVFMMLMIIFGEYAVLFFFCFNEFTYLGIFGIYSVWLIIALADHYLFLKRKLLTYTLVFNFLIRVITKCMFSYMLYLMTIKKFGLYPDLPWHI